MRIICSLSVVCLTITLGAQQSLQMGERALHRVAATRLANFAKIAARGQMQARAQEVWSMILRDYDPNHAGALRGLGFTKVKGEWRAPKRRRNWRDDPRGSARVEVAKAWQRVAASLADLHRTLGLEWYASEAERGRYHLERAIFFRHDDVEAHRALGHGVHEGFWGNDAELAFVQRMQALKSKAIELRQREYRCDPVTTLPKELSVWVAADANLVIHGARSETFTIYVRGSQQEADDCVRWAERAIDFLMYCLPRRFPAGREIRRVQRRRWAWQGFLLTRAEMHSFLGHNPALRNHDLHDRVRWANRGQSSAVIVAMTPAERRVEIISGIWKSLFRGASAPFLEGVAHAATIFLGATASSRSGVMGSRTSTGLRVQASDSAVWWHRQMREQARFASDYALLSLPDLELGEIRRDARLKAWSFVTWTMARLPRRWHEFLMKVPTGMFTKRSDFPDLVRAFFREPLPAIEQEWRAWASGRSTTAHATGHGVPVMLSASSMVERAALEELNRMRGLAGLAPCRLDPELNSACAEQADNLVMGTTEFTRRGMTAVQNTIVIEVGDASGKQIIQRGMGAICYRLALLDPYLQRLGISVRSDLAVLDTRSLLAPRSGDREARYRIVLWPPPGAVGLPDRSRGGDRGSASRGAGIDFGLAGYPVSLQLSRSTADQLVASSISIHQLRGGGKADGLGPALPAWVHLPARPLWPGLAEHPAIVAIPKRPLATNTSYMARVILEIGGEREDIRWQFTTGRSGRGQVELSGR